MRAAAEGGEFQAGITAFAALSCPSATDHRWLGVCLHYEGRLHDAEVRYRQAQHLGDHAACLYVAALLLGRGENAAALASLETVSPVDLADDDAALWYRERARAGWMLGEPRAALLGYAARGWELAATGPPVVQASVAILMGSLLSHFGEYGQALAFLDFAAEHGHARRQEYVALCRAEALIPVRRSPDALDVLTLVVSPPLHALKQLLLVRAHAAMGAWSRVRQELEALLCQVQAQPEEEVLARLWLAALCRVENRHTEGRRHVVRAAALAKTPVRRAEVALLASLYGVPPGQLGAVMTLEEAVETFVQADAAPGLLTAHLVLAEGDAAGRAAHVTRAAQVAATMGAVPDLSADWHVNPAVAAYLEGLPPDAFERLLWRAPAPPTLHLQTLGDAAMWVDGRRVTFRYARAVELLAYLQRHPEVTLGQVQREVLPDLPAARAKNYFHQVRVDIAARVPGLSIAFDPARQTYRLLHQGSFTWDVRERETADVLDALRSAAAPFLPDATSPWAEAERDAHTRALIERGWTALEMASQSGLYSRALPLAEALVVLEPLDAALHVLLVQATAQVHGPGVAWRRARASAETFRREVGDVPDALTRLQNTLEEVT